MKSLKDIDYFLRKKKFKFYLCFVRYTFLPNKRKSIPTVSFSIRYVRKPKKGCRNALTGILNRVLSSYLS